MVINYNDKVFKPVSNTDNGETSGETVFYYTQTGNIVCADYAGGKIIKEHLLGIMDEGGRIEMRYHQINEEGCLMTGVCKSIPEVLSNGKIRLHESWHWTSGDLSAGRSIIEEI